jgi:hypothetical protein
MRRQFPGYYRPKQEDFAQKFKECIFCFDTNVLLNLYRYKPESRDNLLEVLQALKDRVWLPHQVAREYQRRRIEVLLGQLHLAGKLEGLIDATMGELEKLRRSSPLFAVNALIDPINTDLEAIKGKLQEEKQEKPDLMTGDTIFDTLTDLFDGKVGNPFKPEKYKEIYQEGKERYDGQIPPGYMDKSNKPDDTDQYGDLVLWLQLLDFAKAERRPVILVTDDAKEDWWREMRGEKLGPRPELIDEFMAVAGGGKWFYMYSTEQFLKYAKEYLNADVKPEVIKEAEGIEKQDAELEQIRITSEVVKAAHDALLAGQEGPILEPSLGGIRLPLSELAIPRFPPIDFLKVPKIDIPQMPKIDIPRMPDPFIPRIQETAIPQMPDLSRALRPILEQQAAIERVASGLGKMLAMQDRLLNPLKGIGGSLARLQQSAQREIPWPKQEQTPAPETKPPEQEQRPSQDEASEKGQEPQTKPGKGEEDMCKE